MLGMYFYLGRLIQGVEGMDEKSVKKRRNIYMGQEYLDMEAIAVNERKKTGRDVTVADLIRRACREFRDNYWRNSVHEGKKD